MQQKIRGNAEKHPLTASPFIVEFEFGIENEGYWCYVQMVTQMDDCLDILHTLNLNLMYYYNLIIPVVIINSKDMG